MLHIIWGKIKNNIWLMFCLLIGNILLISTVSSIPMYSAAIMQRIFIKELEAVQLETGKYPGLLSLRLDSVGVSGENGLNRIENLGNAALYELEADYGVPVLNNTKILSSSAMRIADSVTGNSDKTAYLRSSTDFENNIEIISGSYFVPGIKDNVIEAVVNEATYASLDLLIGNTYQFGTLKNPSGDPYLIKIAGVFKNKEGSDLYWSSITHNLGSHLYIDEQLFHDLYFSEGTTLRLDSAQWNVAIDYHALKASEIGELTAATAKYRDFYEKRFYAYKDYVSQVTDGFGARVQRLNLTLWVLETPIFVLLAAFIFMVARQILALDQNEIAVIKSRGGTRAQILRIYLGISVIIASAALSAGVPLGMAVCGVLGASNGFLEFVGRAALPIEISPSALLLAAGTAVFSAGAMIVPAIRFSKATIVGHKQRKSGAKKVFWMRYFLDIILLVFSLYELFSFTNQKEFLAESIAGGASLDPLIFLSSSLFMLGAGLLLIRLFAYAVKLVYMIGKSWWPPSLYASFLRVIRSPGEEQFIMIFLILALSTGVFNACIARTIDLNNEHALRYNSGADIVLKEEWIVNPRLSVGEINEDGTITYKKVVYHEPDYTRYTTLPETDSVTKVYSAQNASVTGVDRKAKIQVMGVVSDEFGRTAWLRNGLLPSHFYDYLNALAQNPEAVIVSSHFRDTHGFSLGDKISYTAENMSYSGVICGFVDFWPGYDPILVEKDYYGVVTSSDRMLIVANLAGMQRSQGVMPYEVWIKASGRDTGFIYQDAESNGILYTKFSDVEAALVKSKNDPIFQGTNGVLTMGFISILAVCMAGFLIYWILSIRSRELQFGIFRAMGLGMRSIISMLAVEQALISGSAIIAGVGIGALTSVLFVPLIQMGYLSGAKLPLFVAFDSNDSMRLLILTGVMLAVCMAVLGEAVRKIRIAQALKLGED